MNAYIVQKDSIVYFGPSEYKLLPPNCVPVESYTFNGIGPQGGGGVVLVKKDKKWAIFVRNYDNNVFDYKAIEEDPFKYDEIEVNESNMRYGLFIAARIGKMWGAFRFMDTDRIKGFKILDFCYSNLSDLSVELSNKELGYCINTAWIKVNKDLYATSSCYEYNQELRTQYFEAERAIQAIQHTIARLKEHGYERDAEALICQASLIH